MKLVEHRAVRIEKRQLLQIEDIVALLRIALGKDCHTAADIASCLFNQLLQRSQGL